MKKKLWNNMEKMVYVVLHFLLGLVGRGLSDDTFVSFMQWFLI